jgi:hypothetical protein
LEDEDESEDEDEDEQEDEGPEAIEDIDWEKVLPKLRKAVVDPSNVRRRAFVSKYLQVSSDCALSQFPASVLWPVVLTPASVPPPDQVPAIISNLLPTLPLLASTDQVDDVVGVLMALVRRDEQLPDGQGKLKLGDKLVKWVTMESEKAAGPSRSCVPILLAFKPKLVIDGLILAGSPSPRSILTC